MSNENEREIKMNPKRVYCELFLCAVFFCVITGIGAAVKFGGRLPELKQQMENANLSVFTASDLVFLGCVIGAFWILLSVYWLYTTAYAVCRAKEMGANAWLFGTLTLITNIFGVACLWGVW